MRERQDAHLRSSQTGHGRDRRRVQRRLHYGRQYLAAFQGNYRGHQPFETPRMDVIDSGTWRFLCVCRVASRRARLNPLAPELVRDDWENFGRLAKRNAKVEAICVAVRQQFQSERRSCGKFGIASLSIRCVPLIARGSVDFLSSLFKKRVEESAIRYTSRCGFHRLFLCIFYVFFLFLIFV